MERKRETIARLTEKFMDELSEVDIDRLDMLRVLCAMTISESLELEIEFSVIAVVFAQTLKEFAEIEEKEKEKEEEEEIAKEMVDVKEMLKKIFADTE